MARLLTEYQEDFSRGMNDSWVANRHPPDAARLILNGRVQPDGTVSRRDGTRRKNGSVLNADIGYGAVTFQLANGDEQEVAIFGDTAYMSDDNWATNSQIATGLREDYYDFATMEIGATNYLYLANGDTTIKTWDGSTWSTLSGAPSGVKYVEVFNSRLWVSGHNGVLVQGSKVADPTAWTGAAGSLTVSILTHAGDPPTGLFTLGPHLLVFDRHATSYIDGFGEQTLIVAQGATGFSRSVGCVAFRTIAAVGDDGVCWLSARGVEFYSASTGIVLLTREIQDFVSTIEFSTIDNTPGVPTGVYDPGRLNYHCAVPVDSSQNSRSIVVNLYHRGRGWVGAPAIDEQDYTAGTELLFGGDGDGYLAIDANGYALRPDVNGYTSLATAGSAGDPVVEDANGYLDVDTNDAVPATLYLAPSVSDGLVVTSAGYDGFVRRHYGSDLDLDDETATPDGGSAVELRLVPRPFVMGSARQKKRVRVVHVGAINDAQATISVAVRAAGSIGDFQDITIAATDYDQIKRGRAMVTGVGDTPQVELRTTDRTRVALVGVGAEILREPVG